MNERGAWTFGPIIGFVIVVLAIIGLFAVCTDGDDDVGLGRLEVASHDWGGYDCYGHDYCGGWGGGSDGNTGYAGGGGRSGDYDGGPGDDCRNACGNRIIVPTPGSGERS